MKDYLIKYIPDTQDINGKLVYLKNALKNQVFQQFFRDEYTLGEVLGKGNYAKVKKYYFFIIFFRFINVLIFPQKKSMHANVLTNKKFIIKKKDWYF